MISKVANCSKFRDNGFEKTGANVVSNLFQGLSNFASGAARRAGRDAGVGFRGMFTHDAGTLNSMASFNRFNNGYNGMLENMLKSNPGMTMEQATQALANQGIHQMGTMIPQAGQAAGQMMGQVANQAVPQAATLGAQLTQNAAPLAMGAAALGGTTYVGNRVFGRPNYGYPRYY